MSKNLSEQVYFILTILPQPTSKPELLELIQVLLGKLSKTKLSESIINKHAEAVLKLLEKKSSLIQERSVETYRPLASSSEKYFGISETAENKLNQYLHTILADILELLDTNKIINLNAEELQETLNEILPFVIKEKKLRLSDNEQKILSSLLASEILGLGPIDLLLQDPSVSDILVNSADSTYIEKNGKLIPTHLKFISNDHLLHIIKRIVNRSGRRIDESNPYVDTKLPDGSRINAIIPPIAIDAPYLSIRKFNHFNLSLNKLVMNEAMSAEMAGFLSLAVRAKMNIIISGGTGSGKTTLLNALSWAISNTERIITIEDSAELKLQQPHVVRLETKNKNISGSGGVSQKELLINSLRMRPDRIIIGEVRGQEAFDLLNAMNTGHEGSMSTIHANTPKDALARLNNMIAMAEMELSEAFAMRQIGSTINLIVQAQRLTDGNRKITEIAQVYWDSDKGKIISEPLFSLDYKKSPDSDEFIYQFKKTSHAFKHEQRFAAVGLDKAFMQLKTFEESSA